MLPAAVSLVQKAAYQSAFAFHTLQQKPFQATVHIKRRNICQPVGAGYRQGLRRVYQRLIVVPQHLGYMLAQLQRRQRMAVLQRHRDIILVYDMKHHVVIGAVEVVMVSVPVG